MTSIKSGVTILSKCVLGISGQICKFGSIISCTNIYYKTFERIGLLIKSFDLAVFINQTKYMRCASSGSLSETEKTIYVICNLYVISCTKCILLYFGFCIVIKRVDSTH